MTDLPQAAPQPDSVALITLCGLRRQAADRPLVVRHLRRWSPEDEGARLDELFDRAASALCRYSRCWVEGLIGHAEMIARAEALALTALATRQHGGAEIARQALEMLAVPGWSAALADPLNALADGLSARRCSLPLVVTPAAGGPRRILDPRAANVGAPAPEEVHALESGERLLIEGLRFAVDGLRHDRRVLPDLETALRRKGYFDCGPALETLVRIIAAAASRPVDIRCRGCPALSPDEGRLSQAVALLQRCDEKAAEALLHLILPAAARRMALPPLRGIALGLLNGNTVLPLRDWRFREGDGLPRIWAEDHRAGATLH